MIKGTIFNIQRFSIHDGPGIRTTVFLKGCPLRCLWCHNPEGLSREIDIEYSPVKCIGCGRCRICPNGCHSIRDGGHYFDRDKCDKCGKCVEACVSGSLLVAGKDYTVDEVMKKVESDVLFYKESGGGMTISGGEPFYQSEFTAALFKAAKEKGIHTAVETCGFCSDDALQRALPYIDLFLFDYKVTGAEAHKAATGVDNGVILKNLKTIDDAGKKITLRCPIIPSINDNNEHFEAIANIANTHENIVKVDLEPYHDLGAAKYTNIGKTPAFSHAIPEKERMAHIKEYIEGLTEKKINIS